MSNATGTATAPRVVEDPLPHEAPGSKHRYSFIKALRQASELGGEKNSGRLDGLELEVSQEIARRAGIAPQGFYVPWSSPIAEARDLTSSSGAGAVRVRTDVQLIDLLRARAVCAQLGARMPVLAGPGNLRLPRRTATSAVSWVAEGAAPGAQTNQVLAGLEATPKTMAAFCDVSKAMLASQPLTSSVVAEDFAAAMAAELDRVALVGTGANDQSTGIRATAGVGSVAIGANGGAPTWSTICALEETLGLANGDVGSVGLVTTPAARSKLRRSEKAAGSGMIWTDEQRVAGYPALATTSMPANLAKGTGTNLSALILGSWDDLMLPLFGALDVLVDPYKLTTAGIVRITAFLSVDVLVRRPASFCQASDIVTT